MCGKMFGPFLLFDFHPLCCAWYVLDLTGNHIHEGSTVTASVSLASL